jgi:hypothetical protein
LKRLGLSDKKLCPYLSDNPAWVLFYSVYDMVIENGYVIVDR